MRIHKRIIDLHASSDAVGKITGTIAMEPGVDVSSWFTISQGCIFCKIFFLYILNS